MLRLSFLFASLFAAAAPAEPVLVSIQQQTTFGESVFVSAHLPELGSGDYTKSVKLSPHAYPIWQATMDLPTGIDVPMTFLLRDDAPGSLGDSSNFFVIETRTITVPGSLPAPIAYGAYAPAAIPSTSATIFRPAQSNVTIDFVATLFDANTKLFAASVPSEHFALRHTLRLNVGGTQLPTDGPVYVQGRPIWFRHNQAFTYDPATMTSAPSAARIETFTFAPSNFATRTIRVLLPRGYNENTSATYPVLYAQDGQNVFDPGGPFGSWSLDAAVRALIARGEIPEIIVVAIDNSNDRFAEYVPEYGSVGGTPGRGGEFLTMLRNQLLPDVNARYRTRTGPENTAHIGSSLGGLLGYHAANDFEQTFGAVVAMSPSFQVNLDENLLRAGWGPDERGRLYLDSGTSGTSADGYQNCVAVRDALIASGHVRGPQFWYAVGNGQQHNEAAWKSRTPDALRWLYGPMMIADSTTSSTWTIR